MARNIGFNVPTPEKECEDVNCPFHGTLPVRGQVITGNAIVEKINAQGSTSGVPPAVTHRILSVKVTES